MSELQNALDWFDAYNAPEDVRVVRVINNSVFVTLAAAARLVANLPNFSGFDYWYDALVVRGVSYIDVYDDEDDGLIQWVAALLVIFKERTGEAMGSTPPAEETRSVERTPKSNQEEG